MCSQRFRENVSYERTINSINSFVFWYLLGASVFFHDFIKEWMRLQEIKQLPMEYDFVRVKSYEGLHSTGDVSISGLTDEQLVMLQNKHVIIVEDIIDTGLTMSRYIH